MNAERKSWEPMRVVPAGNLAEVLRAGGGKLSPTTGDPGDIRKPKGLG